MSTRSRHSKPGVNLDETQQLSTIFLSLQDENVTVTAT
jgi:hypothetical protein